MEVEGEVNEDEPVVDESAPLSPQMEIQEEQQSSQSHAEFATKPPLKWTVSMFLNHEILKD